MPSDRNQTLAELLKNEAAKFLSAESNRTSMITVTNVQLSSDGKRAMILFTVLPVEQENAALDFAKRKRGEFLGFVRENTRIARIPFFDFAIDKGEKHRQMIDVLSEETKK